MSEISFRKINGKNKFSLVSYWVGVPPIHRSLCLRCSKLPLVDIQNIIGIWYFSSVLKLILQTI